MMQAGGADLFPPDYFFQGLTRHIYDDIILSVVGACATENKIALLLK